MVFYAKTMFCKDYVQQVWVQDFKKKQNSTFETCYHPVELYKQSTLKSVQNYIEMEFKFFSLNFSLPTFTCYMTF
jgi:hypothetical protein